MNKSDIQIRDPFILPVKKTGLYYLFGSTGKDIWKSGGTGFDCYTSPDLEDWTGPVSAFRPPAGFWADKNFWAPEVHYFNDKYCMFASFKADGKCRGTQILSSDNPEGPYIPLTEKPVTPKDWECLDGTLFVDKSRNPWIVFCHEWVQVSDGEIQAMPLTKDLKTPTGPPRLLFKASSAEWPKLLPRRDGTEIVDARVTDGPFIPKSAKGGLIILWSSLSPNGYAMGTAWSESGSIEGPWIQSKKPIIECDGGHGMLFRGFNGKLYITWHSPNNSPMERFHFQEVSEEGNSLILTGKPDEY